MNIRSSKLDVFKVVCRPRHRFLHRRFQSEPEVIQGLLQNIHKSNVTAFHSLSTLLYSKYCKTYCCLLKGTNGKEDTGNYTSNYSTTLPCGESQIKSSGNPYVYILCSRTMHLKSRIHEGCFSLPSDVTAFVGIKPLSNQIPTGTCPNVRIYKCNYFIKQILNQCPKKTPYVGVWHAIYIMGVSYYIHHSSLISIKSGSLH